jgi:hypothetical protein
LHFRTALDVEIPIALQHRVRVILDRNNDRGMPASITSRPASVFFSGSIFGFLRRTSVFQREDADFESVHARVVEDVVRQSLPQFACPDSAASAAAALV